MATEVQYNVFKSVYDEETRRRSDLQSKANLYLTVITAYLGLIGFKAADIIRVTSKARVPIAFYLALAGALSLALLLTVLAIGIREYEVACDLEEVIESFGPDPPTDSEFLDDRLVELAVAANCNLRQNNRVASLLQGASISLASAVLLQLILFLIIITRVGR